MAFDSEKFFNELLADAKISDEEKTQIEAAKATISKNPVLAKRLEESTLRQSEFSKGMNDLKDKVKQATDYYSQLTDWEKEKKKEFEDKEKQLTSNGGVPSSSGVGKDNTPGEIDLSEFVDRKTFEEAAKTYEDGALGVIIGVTKYTQDYHQRFGEYIDPEILITRVMNDGVSLEEAYRREIEPKVEEQRQQELQAKIEAAKAEGAEEALAKVQFTGSPFEVDPGVVDRLNTPADERSPVGVEAAVDAWLSLKGKNRN